jgi:putative transposase
MPIRKEQFFPGGLFHVYNRGNGKQDIFYNDRDRYRFLQAMLLSNNSASFLTIEELERSKDGYTLADIKTLLEANKVISDPLIKIYIDCLMPNHYHFLLEEIKVGGISLFMKKLGISYAKYFTIKYKRPGSLFQGRFKSVFVKTDDQLKYLLAYINIINPAQLIAPELKEKGIKDFDKVFSFSDNYNWSTHQEFAGRRESMLIDKNNLLQEMFYTPDIYLKFIKDVLRGKEEKIWASVKDVCFE